MASRLGGCRIRSGSRISDVRIAFVFAGRSPAVRKPSNFEHTPAAKKPGYKHSKQEKPDSGPMDVMSLPGSRFEASRSIKVSPRKLKGCEMHCGF